MGEIKWHRQLTWKLTFSKQPDDDPSYSLRAGTQAQVVVIRSLSTPYRPMINSHSANPRTKKKANLAGIISDTRKLPE